MSTAFTPEPGSRRQADLASHLGSRSGCALWSHLDPDPPGSPSGTTLWSHFFQAGRSGFPPGSTCQVVLGSQLNWSL